MSSRSWIKINCDRWFSGSIRKEPLELRAVWTDVLALAGRTGTDGFIRLPGTEIGYTDEQLSTIFHIPLELWRRMKDLLAEHPGGPDENRILVHSGNVIEIINWNLYQSEYSRQKSYRQKLQTEVTPESAGRRRGRERERKRSKDLVGPSPSENPQGKDLPPLAVAWNDICGPVLPPCKGVSKDRKEKIALRMKEYPLDKWGEIFGKIRDSSFCKGDNDRNWTATFDWIIRSPESALRVLEGKYDDRKGPGGENGKSRIYAGVTR